MRATSLAMTCLLVSIGTAADAAVPPSAVRSLRVRRDTPRPPAPPPAAKSVTAAVVPPMIITTLSLGLALAAAPTDSDAAAFGGIAGLLVGPSLGHWYAGDVSPLLAVRAAGALAVGLTAGPARDCAEADDIDDTDRGKGWRCSLSEVTLLLGAGALGIGALLEIATTPKAVHAYNRRHRFDLRVAPTTMRAADGTAPGMVLTGRF